MNKTYTKDDILLYIYNEIEEDKRWEIEQAIQNDAELKSFYSESMQVLNRLNTLNDSPSPTIISILGEESRSGSLEVH